jgi:hypothetical protein
VVHKLRSKAESSRPIEEFAVTAKSEVDMKKNPVDFDELLRNFENKTTLNQLRAELEESQRSLASSEDHIKSLSRDIVKMRK